MNTFDETFELTQNDFQAIAFLLYNNVGISLSESKKHLVYNRLIHRIRSKKLSSFKQYIHLLDDKNAPEWNYFLNALTTNLTSFYREPYHFELLAEYASKHLIHKSQTQPIKVWCSACSTGEEAYSIAMTLIDTFGCIDPPVKILATDLNTDVLQRAKKGIYSVKELENLTDQQKKKFFNCDSKKQYFQVKKEVKALISFKRLNLISKQWPMAKQFDVIFCRNVMIYFDKQTQQQLLRKLAHYLPIDARLFIGHSESISTTQTAFKLMGQTMYKRV
ncbi:chemotaxis protein methyltransferase [Psychromonas marina]|uniref:Chemotaxis protein methyltransferase n=1 Tax=Psychromonas marina TaxID=88364 RepID=A0ABQ6E4T4_9GAMM|nr:protein-glutamate O-methyltransferase CheR [Psychromonas marina]GLS92417.1 chemotaxis protein methyltransferase [Psychromonas marina]